MRELREQLTNESKKKFGCRRSDAVKEAVLTQLLFFCEQDAEFLQAVKDSGKGLEACCETIMKGVGSSISDIEVYRRMVNFYFPGADITFQISVNLIGEAEQARGSITQNASRAVVLDLFSELL